MIERSDLRSALDQLPRTRLAFLPTPLHRAERLSQELGIDLWFKRDDLTGLALGGNKVRKLEYIVGDAQEHGATRLLTTAAAQSNFCRVVAAAGVRAGIKVGLVLRSRDNPSVQGNFLLDRVLGADIRITSDMDPYSTATRAALDAWAQEEQDHGGIPYVIYIHNGSRTGALATAAYVDATLELEQQCRSAGIGPAHLYVAVGSGSTLAGLALGRALNTNLLSATRLRGVCVSLLSEVVQPKVLEFAQACAGLLGAPADEVSFTLDDSQRGTAYAVPTEAALEAIGRVARREAVVLNPVYTAKAFAALLADVKSGVIRRDETVVFMHTGGDPLVFAHAASIESVVDSWPN